MQHVLGMRHQRFVRSTRTAATEAHDADLEFARTLMHGRRRAQGSERTRRRGGGERRRRGLQERTTRGLDGRHDGRPGQATSERASLAGLDESTSTQRSPAS
jgi:hypothetical protein